jgi:sulfatase modifying factor 1
MQACSIPVILALLLGGCLRAGFENQQGSSPIADSAMEDQTPDAAPDTSTADLADLSPSDQVPPDSLQPDLAPIPGNWVLIPPVSAVAKMPVTFKMGSPASEPCRTTDTEVQHNVTLTRRFEIMDTEVTQKMFQDLMGYNLSNFGPNGTGANCGASCPVEMVSWYEVAAYCNKLSSVRGLDQCYDYVSGSQEKVVYAVKKTYDGSGAKTICDCPGYRLPTEAEFEYAYRAGTTTAYYSGASSGTNCADCSSPPKDSNADKIAWYCSNSGGTTHPTKQKPPNLWGLYDIAGNVYEWCHDWWIRDIGTNVTDPWGPPTGTFRTLRGGNYKDVALFSRAASRQYFVPQAANIYVGFRVVRGVSAP